MMDNKTYKVKDKVTYKTNDKIKDFKVKQGGRGKTPVENIRLANEAIKDIKGGNKVTPDSYLAVANNGRIGDVEPEMVKARVENHLEVPNNFYELTLPEQSMLMFYLSSDFVHPYIGKRTHMNMTMSYITAYIDDDEVKRIYKERKITDDDGNVIDYKYDKVKDYKRYNEIKLEAMKVFSSNRNIQSAWDELVRMTFSIEPKELLKTVILQDALTSENYNDRNANRKMLIDILGIGKEYEQVSQFNVFMQGGGKELASTIKQYTNDEYLVTEDDLSVDD